MDRPPGKLGRRRGRWWLEGSLGGSWDGLLKSSLGGCLLISLRGRSVIKSENVGSDVGVSDEVLFKRY